MYKGTIANLVGLIITKGLRRVTAHFIIGQVGKRLIRRVKIRKGSNLDYQRSKVKLGVVS